MKNDLLRRVPFLMHRVVSATVAAAIRGERAGEFNIHGARVMVALLNDPGMSVGELCELTRFDQTNMSHLLRRLLRQGVLTKSRSPADNRVVEVRLTPAGEELAKEFHERGVRHEKILLRGFNAAEAKMLRSFLNRMFANVADGSFD